MSGLLVEAAATIGCNFNASYSTGDLITLSASDNEACSCVVTAHSSLSLYLDIVVKDVQVDSGAVYWSVVKVMGIYMCTRSNMSHSTMFHMTTDEELRLRLYGAEHTQVTVAVTFQGICCVVNPSLFVTDRMGCTSMWLAMVDDAELQRDGFVSNV